MERKKNKKKILVKFRLVSRSQQDPLINYEDAPKAVLVEEKLAKDKKAEQRKYGIYYDDDYDYLQHLKGVEEVEDYYFEEFDPKGTRIKEIQTKDEIEKEKGIIKLPSSAFPSQYQENVGMLNKGALPTGIRPDWDPDIVEALCDDFDLEDENNILDDDFVTQAMGGEIKKCEEDSDDELDFKIPAKVKWDDQEFGDDNLSDKISDEDERHTIRTFGCKTEFTNYSLSSSVILRNEKLNDLDERFENFFLNDIKEEEEFNKDDFETENDDNENEILKNLINGHEKEKKQSEFSSNLPKEKIIKIAEQQLKEEEENKEELEEIEFRLATGKNEYEDRWDCQSILSNYSNIYHRPKLILEQKSNKIIINKKTGMPEESGDKMTEKNLKKLNKQDEDQRTIRSMTSLISQLSIRNKDESKEEKQQRKKNLKEYMKERRQEKKANKLAFKEENLKLNHEKVVNRQLTAIKFN